MTAEVVEWEDRKPDVRQEQFLHTMLDARQQEVPRSGKPNQTHNGEIKFYKKNFFFWLVAGEVLANLF